MHPYPGQEGVPGITHGRCGCSLWQAGVAACHLCSTTARDMPATIAAVVWPGSSPCVAVVRGSRRPINIGAVSGRIVVGGVGVLHPIGSGCPQAIDVGVGCERKEHHVVLRLHQQGYVREPCFGGLCLAMVPPCLNTFFAHASVDTARPSGQWQRTCQMPAGGKTLAFATPGVGVVAALQYTGFTSAPPGTTMLYCATAGFPLPAGASTGRQARAS